MLRLTLLLLLSSFLAVSPLHAQTSPEQRTARYMESVRQKPGLLLAFLRDMPKGGDLHNHLAGAVYAESWIDFAAENGQCVDRTTSNLIAPPCDSSCERFTSKPAVRCAYSDQGLYNSIVDAWSMRNWVGGSDNSGHDHFFAAFDKFIPAQVNHNGDAIAAAASLAASDHLQYLELMHTADDMGAAQLGARLGWDDDLGHLREKLDAGLKDLVNSTRSTLDQDEARMRSLLHCGTSQDKPACHLTIRYLYQVLRGLPKESVFAQMALGFALASSDPRFVGLNLVMPEDWYVPMHDFDLHMKMLDYLHAVYPKVHITLHAGELAMGQVPPESLTLHIRESIERGHAERIGHGTSVMNESNPIDLLKKMAAKKIAVEISLSSSDLILGIKGSDHPLPIYLQYGVPVVLATDDEGVSRSDLTHEYLRAVQGFNLSYLQLKKIAHNGVQYSFLTPDDRVRVQDRLDQEFSAFEHKF